MAKARQPAKRRSESQFVVAQTVTGPVLGQVVHESATGVVTLRTLDGSTVECRLEGRLVPASDPAIFGEVSFLPAAAEDSSAQIEALLALFRDERRTAEERRAWAAAHGAPNLPDGKDIDELLRYRYEQYRAGWTAALRDLLGEAVQSGNERPLLAALDQSVPTDARRVAMNVAVERRVAAAVPALCAAAIHKTQAGFGQEAARALQALAPERLPLIARAAHPDVVKAIDLQLTIALPEADALAGGVSSATSTAGAASASLRDEVLLHLAVALPLSDQLQLFERAASADIVQSLHRALREPYRQLADKESPTAYELLLRTALAQLVLADSSGALPPELRASAARDLVRDANPELLRALAMAVADTALVLLVRTALSAARADRSNVLLAAIAEHRPKLARTLAPTVRASLSNGQLEPSQRAVALQLLAADPDSHGFVSREVGRELGRESGPHTAELIRAVVRHEVPVELARVRGSVRGELLRALPLGSSEYATVILDDLRTHAENQEAWSSMDGVLFPDSWIAIDPGFREALLGWLPTAVCTGVSPAVRKCFVAALALEAAARWTGWPTTMREAALSLLADVPSAESAPLLAAVVARLEPGDRGRVELLAYFAERILAVAPDQLPAITAVVPDEELRRALLAQGAALERRSYERQRQDQEQHTDSGRRLAADLRAELERAIHALGRDDQLGVLFARLAEEVGSLTQREADADPEIANYLEEFPDAPGRHGGAGQNGDALIAALRRLGGRSRSSQAALAFFGDRVAGLLDGMTREELEAFVAERRRVLDRLDLAAIEPIAVALLRLGTDPDSVWALLGGGPDTGSAINVAFRVGESHPQAALGLLSRASVELQSLAHAVGTRSAEWKEITARRDASAGGAVDLARRLAPTLEAIEGVLLNYMRVRHVLAAHGLAPVEPILGNVRATKELIPGTHRVVGLGIAEGTYEVLTHGVRLTGGEIIVPAVVARRADEEPEEPRESH